MSFQCGIAKMSELQEELDLLCECSRAYTLEIYSTLTRDGELLVLYGISFFG